MLACEPSARCGPVQGRPPVLIEAALANLLSPMVLFFALGAGAALLRSDLDVPEAIDKGLALYLMLGIGFKGGVAVAGHGAGLGLVGAIAGGALLSIAGTLLAFALLSLFGRLGRTDAAAIAAHYGSVSLVTFLAGAEYLALQGIAYEGYMIAVLAVMETPPIVLALWLAGRAKGAAPALPADVLREVALNGSVVLLVGAFAIGWATGARGMTAVEPFIGAPFKGVLCLFLLDMGLVAARRLREGRALSARLVLFALLMPFIGAALGGLVGTLVGLSLGGCVLFATLGASASYIAVPAAMRLALPKANPALSLGLALAVTFPFNIALGIPLYQAALAAFLSP